MLLECPNMLLDLNNVTMFCDPCISRIQKINAKKCPKFLDLYASIYGTSTFSQPSDN